MEFASPAWSPWLEGDKKKLEAVQEKALKMVTGLNSKNYRDRCREVGLETLERRRERQDMAEVYRMMEENQRENILQRAGNGARVRTRREADQRSLKKQYSRTDPRKYSFGVRVTDMWNGLSVETRESKDGTTFKKRLRVEWREKEE